MYKHIYNSIIILFLIPHIAFAELPKNFKKLIDQYRFEESSFAFAAQNLSDNNASPIIYNGEHLFNSASLVKIISTYISLKDLGPNYQWQSDFYYSGKVENEVLNGDLIFTGGGDATFSIEDLEKMIRRIQSKGIKKINGDLILDYSFFGKMPIEKDFDENPLRAYNVLPSAITVQSNTINFKLSTQKNKIKVIADPNLNNLFVSENLRISNGKCGNWKSRLRIIASENNNKNSVEFSGGFSRHCNEKEIDLAILDQSHYFFEIFKDLWNKNGGFFDGSYRKEYKEDLSKRHLCTHFSRPLSELIRDVNKYSLNLMARNLMLTVIKEKKDVQPTEDMVNTYIQTWLKEKGLPHKGLYIDNGAGLSRKIQISVNQLLLILQNIYNDPFMPEMIASFPIASIDGTLKNKMKKTKFSRNGHFKTGSLKNVVGIAGFFLSDTKEMKAFVFMMNHKQAKNAQPFIEDLIDLTFLN
tara:strand:- start:2048 stop:3457 length:1410 start_codon:yes stop_codon:yes gene_type:complete